jgi:hypothetical protein
MPHPDDISAAEPTADRLTVAVGCLSNIDVLANIFAFLGVEEIMQKRRVCKKWKEAVKMTTVPPTDFVVNNVQKFNAMSVMTKALPNLQQIELWNLLCNHGYRSYKWSEGEDPDEEWAALTHHLITRDIEIISNFRNLRILTINNAGLNGRYPVLFNFPLLQKLSIRHCKCIKWDLEMLAGMPMLKELYCVDSHLTGNINSLRVLKDTLETVEISCSCELFCFSKTNSSVTGNINSLRVLKDTLEKVIISCCPNVEGNFMDFADFPHLKELDVDSTAVTGDIRDISERDFSSLERLALPEGVYGGHFYEMQRISEATDLIRAVYLLKKQRPALKMNNRRCKDWYANLSRDSPDWYESADEYVLTPPFYVCFVEAGSRIGYRWETGGGHDKPCEVNWLDPEPERGSTGYEDYVADYRRIQDEVGMYRGYYEPPTEEQYTLLYEEYLAEIQSDDEDY